MSSGNEPVKKVDGKTTGWAELGLGLSDAWVRWELVGTGMKAGSSVRRGRQGPTFWRQRGVEEAVANCRSATLRNVPTPYIFSSLGGTRQDS